MKTQRERNVSINFKLMVCSELIENLCSGIMRFMGNRYQRNINLTKNNITENV